MEVPADVVADGLRMELRFALYTNTFFAGLGGEEQAHRPLTVTDEPVGPARLLQAMLPAGSFRGTFVCGDSHAVEHGAETADAVCQAADRREVDVLLAGPAFDAGRFGIACAQVTSAVQRRLGIVGLTAMFPENPGLGVASPSVLVLPTGRAVGELQEILRRMVDLASRVARLQPLGSPEADGYLPRGGRRNVRVERTGAARAVDLLLRKLRHEPFESEVPLPRRDPFSPAAGVPADIPVKLALVTTGGLVPRDNPDGIESRRASRWAKYPLEGLSTFAPDRFTCVHGGFDNHHVHRDPNRVLPLDAFVRLRDEGRIAALADCFYTTVGAGAPVARAEAFGREIAADLRREGVSAVVLTCT